MAGMYEAIQVGKRQELPNVITNIQPGDTPVLSMIKAGARPMQMLGTVVAEQYQDVAFTGELDNTAVTSFTSVQRDPMTVTGQYWRRAWSVSTLADVTTAAGVGTNEAGHQQVAALLLLKRMIELTLCSAQDSAVESGATPWATRGILGWLDVAVSGVGSYAIPSRVRPTTDTKYTGAGASFAEGDLRSLFTAAFKQRKAMLDLVGVVGPTLRNYIDDFTSVLKSSSSTSQPRTIFRVEGNSTYLNKVTDIEFSSGKATLITSTFIDYTASTGAAGTYSDTSGFFFDPSMFDIGYMKPIANTNLPPDGSGVRGYIDAVGMLRCRNALGQIVIRPTS